MLRPELHGIDALAVDLDGVLYEHDAPIRGAVETIALLQRRQVPFRFVTNTTSIGRRRIADRLSQIGFMASAQEVFCPAHAAAEHLRRECASAALFVQDGTLEEFADVRCDADRPDAVVIGDLGEGWTFERLNAAFRLVHEGARLIALGRSRYWRKAGALQLDVGPFVAALECATSRQALVFGKPDPAFFGSVVDDLGLPARRVAMVGDDIVTDVGAGMQAGLFGVLVRTGKFRESDLDGPIRPDLGMGSLADVVAGTST